MDHEIMLMSKISDEKMDRHRKRKDLTYIVPIRLFSSNSISVTQLSVLHLIPLQSHSLKSLKKRRLNSKGKTEPQRSDPAVEHCNHESPFVA